MRDHAPPPRDRSRARCAPLAGAPTSARRASGLARRRSSGCSYGCCFWRPCSAGRPLPPVCHTRALSRLTSALIAKRDARPTPRDRPAVGPRRRAAGGIALGRAHDRRGPARRAVRVGGLPARRPGPRLGLPAGRAGPRVGGTGLRAAPGPPAPPPEGGRARCEVLDAHRRCAHPGRPSHHPRQSRDGPTSSCSSHPRSAPRRPGLRDAPDSGKFVASLVVASLPSGLASMRAPGLGCRLRSQGRRPTPLVWRFLST